MARGPLTYVPTQVFSIVREAVRHLLRRPVVGVCAVARSADGRILLVRRADTGGWCLPGGTLEWGETLRESLARELAEETGARLLRLGRVTGIYSRPDRDPRFHAVTICVLADVAEPIQGPKNTLEIREAKLFLARDIPYPLSMEMSGPLEDALRDEAAAVWELGNVVSVKGAAT